MVKIESFTFVLVQFSRRNWYDAFAPPENIDKTLWVRRHTFIMKIKMSARRSWKAHTILDARRHKYAVTHDFDTLRPTMEVHRPECKQIRTYWRTIFFYYFFLCIRRCACHCHSKRLTMSVTTKHGISSRSGNEKNGATNHIPNERKSQRSAKRKHAYVWCIGIHICFVHYAALQRNDVVYSLHSHDTGWSLVCSGAHAIHVHS